MARLVKEEEYAKKRNEILDAAQRLIYTKGYERMSIGDILSELQISSGAFYHYFPSKPVLLEAVIERIQQGVEQPLYSLVHDPQLSALEKLQRFFSTLDQSREAHKSFIADLVKVWFADENAIVRDKVDTALVERRAPLLTEIVRQGIGEGSFTTQYPDQAGEIILSIARGMGNVLVKQMMYAVQSPEDSQQIDTIVETYKAYADAIERVLGIGTPFLYRPDAATVKGWLKS
jgi:AcrR family transcriptional regulator